MEEAGFTPPTAVEKSKQTDSSSYWRVVHMFDLEPEAGGIDRTSFEVLRCQEANSITRQIGAYFYELSAFAYDHLDSQVSLSLVLRMPFESEMQSFQTKTPSFDVEDVGFMEEPIQDRGRRRAEGGYETLSGRGSSSFYDETTR